MKTIFQSCGLFWVIQIWWHIEHSTLTALSLRISNSSAGIPSVPLALFIVMLPQVHLPCTPGCLALSEWPRHRGYSSHWNLFFFYCSSVYSCQLFLTSSASVRSLQFLSFIMPIFAWNIPLVSPIVLKRSLIFCIMFSSISLHWTVRKSFLFLLAILWNSAFKWVYLFFSPLPFTSLLFTAICKASSNNHFAFLHFFSLGMVLITASCTVSWTSSYSSSGTLSIRSNPLNLSLPLYNHKEFDLVYTWMVWWFSYFLQFKSEFGNKEFMIWAAVSSQSCFADCIDLLHLWLQRI